MFHVEHVGICGVLIWGSDHRSPFIDLIITQIFHLGSPEVAQSMIGALKARHMTAWGRAPAFLRRVAPGQVMNEVERCKRGITRNHLVAQVQSQTYLSSNLMLNGPPEN
jgi:hypothetical protein